MNTCPVSTPNIDVFSSNIGLRALTINVIAYENHDTFQTGRRRIDCITTTEFYRADS